MTYYDILGVPQTASKDDIRTAYRKLAQDYHPDRLAGVPAAVAKLAEEKFKDVQEAYEVLSKHRAEYDNQLRAVAPPSPPPQSPTPPQARPSSRPTSASTKPPTPRPASTVRSPINSGLYNTGRGIRKAWKWFRTEPYAPAKVAFGAIGLTVMIAIIIGTISDNGTSQATPEKQTAAAGAATVTQIQPNSMISAYDKSGVKPGRKIGDKQVIQGYEYTFDGENWIRGEQAQSPAFQQKTADNKTLIVTPISSSARAEQFGGIVHNQTANASAQFGIVFQDTGGGLSGCMAVGKPLFGSGPLSGHATGADISFQVTSAIGTITFTGKRSSDDINGTYRVEHESSPAELGTFTLNKVKSSNAAVSTNCPTDAEVHQQPVKQTASSDAALKTGDIVVYYADDWEKVSFDCSLLTMRGRELVSLPRSLPSDRMMCGNISGNYSDWSQAPHFTAKIILDDSAVQSFSANTRLSVPLSCAGKLEANGDLHCKADTERKSNLTLDELRLKKPIVSEEATPKPTPKYIALGRIKCYANQRVTLYVDESLAKAFRQLGPGEDIYKVGTFGDSVGVNINSLYADTKPDYWIAGRDIDKLTCGR